jgi:hypothetical protein
MADEMNEFMKKAFLFLLLLLLTSCNSNRTEYVIGVRQNIHHDDFEYSVSNYIVTRFLKNGNDTLFARGVFYLVNFKVENRAKRVEHKWDNSTAYIIDERGNIYDNISNVQQFFDKSYHFGLKEKYITPAATSDSTFLAYDLPFDVTRPFLKVRGEILMGDFFDRASFRRVRIKLY